MATQTEAVSLVVKFGGSAITNKGQLETLKPEALREAAEIIQKCTKRNRCIVVHGAGSFGHHQAKQYNINTGFAHLESNAAHQTRMGFCRTHQSVAKLNACVVDYLLDCDIPAVPCSPCGSWLTSDQVVTSSGLQTVKELLAAGFVPVLHGDTVRDTQLGGSILSGDTIIKHICETFTVERVVFFSDVSGIYDKPPQFPGATLLLRIRVKRDGTLATCVSTSSPRYVTGGIKLKLHTAMDIVRNTNGRTKVFVCRLGSEAAHRLCLGEEQNEDNPDGTEVCLENVNNETLNDHDYI